MSSSVWAQCRWPCCMSSTTYTFIVHYRSVPLCRQQLEFSHGSLTHSSFTLFPFLHLSSTTRTMNFMPSDQITNGACLCVYFNRISLLPFLLAFIVHNIHYISRVKSERVLFIHRRKKTN